MFSRILVPTDGSALAARGVKAGVKLARALGAEVAGVYVIPDHVPALYGEAALYYLSQPDYQALAQKEATRALSVVEREAKAAKAPFTTRTVKAVHPWEGILAAARSTRSDAIVMASHGRSGIGGAILGSETQHVLSRASMPVVVIR